MLKKFIILLFLANSLINHAQNIDLQDINLHKGKWKMCVNDTLVENYCANDLGEYRFFRNGKYKTNHPMIHDGTKLMEEGKWSISGNKLTIDGKDYKGSISNPRTIEIIIVNEDLFFSPRQDYKIVYWVFKRIK